MEAAIALNQFICQQAKIAEYMKQNLREILEGTYTKYLYESSISKTYSALLFLIHETENDELTDVVRKLLCFYCEDIIPFAVNMATNIVQTFLKVRRSKTI